MWGHLALHLSHHVVQHLSHALQEKQRELLQAEQHRHTAHTQRPYLNALTQQLVEYLTHLGYEVDEMEALYLSAHKSINDQVSSVLVFSGKGINPSCAFSAYLLADHFVLGRHSFFTGGVVLSELKAGIDAMLAYPAPAHASWEIMPPPLPARYERARSSPAQ